ncbi:MAG TPA: Gfo/Idh/MocA family oxidoreductase [Candidatus Sulfotelmatobacter sp.]|nr:Gfo/Idh/MocA family oxidoreductase [Candidatus Sulfotelmatobacter sp.]
MKSPLPASGPSAVSLPSTGGSLDITRRKFLASAGTAALGVTLLKPELARAASANSKIDIGVVGCGGRGAWVAELFAKDGRYNVVAVADYFQDRVDGIGRKLNIPENKRFTGLSGYKRLLEQKLDAVAIETPPYFHPEQAAAAVQAGKHVYCAKPIAVDVPGCQSIAESGKQATQKKLTFFVDFQTRAMPSYQEVVSRVHQGGLGQLVTVYAEYQTNLMFEGRDAELRKEPQNPEVRLRTWGIDRTLSGDVITEQNIHALDVATWIVNANPIKAYGRGGRARPFLGDCWDHYSVLFFFPNDLMVTFTAKQVGFGFDDIMVRVHGTNGSAETNYGGKCWFKSRDDVFEGGTDNIYLVGVQRNIATFYDNVMKGECSNPTVTPSVRSNLTTILGRTAAYKKTEVTWDEMMKADEKWQFDPKGLKA